MDILRICLEVSVKVLCNKGFNTAKIAYDGPQRCLAAMVYIFLDKKSSGANNLSGADTRANKAAIESEIMPSQRPLELSMRQIAEELHKRLENLKHGMYTHLLKSISGVQIHNYQVYI